MTIEKFSEDLLKKMGSELSEIEAESDLVKAQKSSSIILEFIRTLETFVSNYKFSGKFEEINFFKNIKPKFLKEMIYFRKVFEIQSRLPVSFQSEVQVYYIRELKRIQCYINRHKSILTYYQSGSVLLDELYFVRKQPDLWLSVNSGEFQKNVFSTYYDHQLSKLLAYEAVSEFLIDIITQSEAECTETKEVKHSKVTWTAPKAALIELLYAIQTSGSCNNGAIDMKQLAGQFENFFHVKLGNFYRTFQEIRIRKISRTTFLDQLKGNLIKRMDESDENPRY